MGDGRGPKIRLPGAPPEALLEILDRLGVGFYRSDLDGWIRSINRAGAAILGFSPEDVVDRMRPTDFDVGTSQRPGLIEQILEEEFVTYDSPVRRKDGSVAFLSSSIRLLRDGQGTPVGFEGVFRDVTAEVSRSREQEALLREVASANDRLLAMGRLQDRLLSSMAHDLVTPPVVIQGFLELLLKGRYGALAPEQEKPLKTIHRNVRLMSGMVEDLLTYTRFLKSLHQDGQEGAGLAEAWRKVAADAAAGKAPRRAWTEEPWSGKDLVPLSAQSLERILRYFMANLLELLPAGSGGRWRVAAATAGPALVVTLPELVPDRPPLDRLLDRFFPEPGGLLEPCEGTQGLGLAAVQYAVTQAGGGLSVAPAGEGGASFSLAFPGTEG